MRFKTPKMLHNVKVSIVYVIQFIMAAHYWLGILLFCCESTCYLMTYTMEDLCEYSRSNVVELQSTSNGIESSAIIKATRYWHYQGSFTCNILLKAPSQHRIIITIREMALRYRCIDNLTITSGCEGQEVEVICRNYRDSNESWVIKVCESGTLNFRTGHTDFEGFNVYSGFQLTVTAYRYRGSCSSFEYECDNGRCISEVLVCDGHNHCGYRRNQDSCIDGKKMSSLNPVYNSFSMSTCSKIYYMEELCKYSKNNIIELQSTSSGFDSSSEVKATRRKRYKSDFTCNILLKAPPEHRIVIAIRKIDLRAECEDILTTTDGCEEQEMEVICWDYLDSNESWVIDTCESGTLNFKSEDSSFRTSSGFELTVTSYRYLGPCSSFEYECSNGRCISDVLVCDGHNHCGDRSDQDNCVDGRKIPSLNTPEDSTLSISSDFNLNTPWSTSMNISSISPKNTSSISTMNISSISAVNTSSSSSMSTSSISPINTSSRFPMNTSSSSSLNTPAHQSTSSRLFMDEVAFFGMFLSSLLLLPYLGCFLF